MQIRTHDLTTNADQLVYEPSSTEIGIRDLIWSPTESKIVFVAGSYYDSHTDGWARLNIINIDGSELQTLVTTYKSFSITSPQFSPDGTRILYINSLNLSDLHNLVLIVDINGRCHYALDSPISEPYQVNLSTDGSVIAFDMGHGVLLAKPDVVYGADFWDKDKQCQ